MASIQTQVDTVKAAVAAHSTCTSTTVVTLKNLLGLDADAGARPTRPGHRATKSTSAAKAKQAEELTLKERAALATHVVNVTIKTLAEAAKAPMGSPSKGHEKHEKSHEKSERKGLRRSLSQPGPLTPVPSRTLNRTATSPNLASKTSKAPTAASQGSKYAATAECTRLALAALRNAKGPITPEQTDFQVENGMWTLAGKLLAIGQNELAFKELRVLKRRLEQRAGTEPTTTDAAVCELLNFKELVSTNSLAIVATCQIYSLKLIAAWKKPAQIEGVLPFLRDENNMSPTNVIKQMAKTDKSFSSKAARQLASLSQTLLSLAPSVSSGEDATALEPRLSPSPAVAFELQCLAFKAQLGWWTIAQHQGKVDDELLAPFSRCARCFVRRAPANTSTYELLCSAYSDIRSMIDGQGYHPGTGPNSPSVSIFQSLGAAAHTAQKYDNALEWYSHLRAMGSEQAEPSVWQCSVTARLVAAALKRVERDGSDVQFVEDAIQALYASLSGTSAEVNELLESLSLARRSVAGLLMSNWGDKSTISTALKESLQKFLMRYPRFVVRWLGSPPGQDAPAKHILQFDQRRQQIMQSVSQVMDGTLMIIKAELPSSLNQFDTFDGVLHECLTLINNLADPTRPSNNLGAYKVKISYLYFTIFNQGRKITNQTKLQKKQTLQALSRSIDAVKDCTNAEKEKASLSSKLEMMAELCKGSGRTEDASKTLRSICTSMVEEGVLDNVVGLLSSQPPQVAWSSSEKALTLSRTLRSIAKLEDTWNDWTFFLPEAERAAVLEHLLQITTEDKTRNKPLSLHHPGMGALLRLYTPDKYPIRRLRVLLKLYSQQLGQGDQLRETTTLLDQALRYLQKKDTSEDAGLTQYVLHLQNYHKSVLALGSTEGAFPATIMRDVVATWSVMVDSCGSAGEVLSKIDDPDALLEHLVGANQLAGMKGESHLQLSILELCLKLARTYASASGGELVSCNCKLARQYIDVGLFTEASATLETTRGLLNQDGVPADTLNDFYLSQARYLAGIDKNKEAMDYLSKINANISSSLRSKSQTALAEAQASHMQSILLLRSGDVAGALRAARSTVKGLSSEWTKFDGPSLQPAAPVEKSLAESVLGNAAPKSQTATYGVHLWTLARPLFDSLMHISAVYAHIGAYQETLYYCETAQRIADGSQSSLFKAECSAWAASIFARSGQAEKAAEKFNEAVVNMPEEACAARINLARHLGEVCRLLDDEPRALEYLATAEETTRQLASREQQAEESPKPASTTAARQAKKPATTRARAATTTTARKTTRARAATTAARGPAKRTVATKGRVASPPATLVPKDVYQASLLASILLTRATGALQTKDWKSAGSALEMVKQMPKFLDDLRQEQLLTAAKHISQSLDQMVKDPVFSILHDSTISFPAILASAEKERRLSTGQSPPRRGRANTVKSAKVDSPAFVEALRQAQEVLLEAHASALASGDNATLHRISTLLQSTVISLTATSSPKIKSSIQLESTTVAVEVARNTAWKREQLTIEAANNPVQIARPQSEDASVCGLSEQMADLGLTTEMARFQNDFIELVPQTWNVVSLSLSENQHDLCITKFQAGHSPFILRLPLERTNARDADSEIFNFEHGREEMMDIIKGANRTSHNGGGLDTKAARNAWWDERAELDERLKELLMVIETTWLGGFKGIFSQHQRRPDLLARFQKSFHQTLERNLPSRNGGGGRGKKKTPPSSVTLDPRILDLFIGLGDPTDPDVDFDEALNDLLYFVVDILQFHGERNAYDEIDFDGMVVEIYDAMRGYYSEIKADGGRQAGAHTVLVLDKALHAFPWESMPCLRGLPVSRVPSLAALQRLIKEAKTPVNAMRDGLEVEQPSGHYVSKSSGTCILNPSSDLKNTQSYFEPSFSSLAWTSHINTKPTETHFETALSTSEILLYFGHGGGAQYIRGKTIRRLEKCKPATFLMGCSSAALTEAGEFEPYGPVWNYLTSGCPAVVGTLWDVTDRDIDRFAGRAFEEWGLFDRGTFPRDNKGKKPTIDEFEEARETGSLAEAVARARGACRFEYLNAAAVVMYGIPVYIEKTA